MGGRIEGITSDIFAVAQQDSIIPIFQISNIPSSNAFSLFSCSTSKSSSPSPLLCCLEKGRTEGRVRSELIFDGPA
jgi:hypothetical protein